VLINALIRQLYYFFHADQTHKHMLTAPFHSNCGFRVLVSQLKVLVINGTMSYARNSRLLVPSILSLKGCGTNFITACSNMVKARKATDYHYITCLHHRVHRYQYIS